MFIVPLLGVLFESVGRTDFTVQHYVKVFDDAVLMQVLGADESCSRSW